jgi:hypothetical protein
MKLLFNKNNTGSTELKKHLGFIDANINYQNITADINTSTNDVIKLISKTVYDLAVVAYEKTSPDESEIELINTIRYPIAVNAYRLFIPSNDLSHSNNGRKMRSDENEKAAFEWMIDRDNQALERRYYRALDDLILYLDDCPIEGVKTAWKASESYKQTHNNFVRTVDDFNKTFQIDSRLILIKVSNGLKDAELNHVLPIINQTRFENLKTKLKDSGTLTPEDKKLIALIQTATVLYAMAWAMQRLSVSLLPEGVLQHYTNSTATTQAKTPTKKSETEATRLAFMQDFQKALKDIENFVTPPAEIIPLDTPLDFKIITGSNFIST